MSLTAIILAAGQSTRMKSRRPKPLHEVCGRPMIEYIFRACFEAGCTKLIVVVGYGKEDLIAQFADDKRIVWVDQAERKGTGHAVQMCIPELKKVQGGHGEVLISAADLPLLRGEVLKTLLGQHREEKVVASLATAMIDDPTGYGRIIRDAKGEFVEIREQLDCTPEQTQIREVFPSIYCVKVEELIWGLGQLRNDNRKGEYYLTDIFRHLRTTGKRVLAIQALTSEETVAPNTRGELALADALMQERIKVRIRDGGVTIVSPEQTYIEDGASVGADTVIHPFSHIGRDASIGADCVIGPFAMVERNAIVPDGTTVAK